MFAYKYKMKVVNEAKNIVTLSPTAGTWVKALLPSLIIGAVFLLPLFTPKKTANIEDTEEDPFNLQ